MFENNKQELMTIAEQSSRVLNSLTNALDKGKLAPEQLSMVLDAQERIMDRQAKQEFILAMADAQAAMPEIIKNKYNKHTKSHYESLDGLNALVSPVYTEHNFSVSFGTADCPLENFMRITANVAHRGGHVEPYQYDLPYDLAGPQGTQNKSKTHACNSTMQYGRRQLLKMIFNLTTVDEADDDGNAAGAEPVELITDEQANILHSKLTDNDINMELFMGWLRKIFPSITSIDNVPVKYYDRVNDKIDETIKQKNKAAK